MKKTVLTSMILLLIAIGGCYQSGVNPPQNVPTSLQLTETIKPTNVPPTSTNTPQVLKTETIYPTPTASIGSREPISISMSKCFEIKDSPVINELNGKLVYRSPDMLSLYSFDQHQQRDITGDLDSAGVSPNGKWLAYDYFTPSHEREIRIESVNGEQQFTVPVGPGSWYFGTMINWLDNQRVWVSTPAIDSNHPDISPLVILNPFTGNKIIEQPNYPGMLAYRIGSNGSMRMHFGTSSLFFDPSLKFVIYPEFQEGTGYYLTVWNNELQKAIARIPSNGDYGHQPIWLPVENSFLVVGYPNNDVHQEEWMTINQNGEINRISQFSDLGKDYKILNDASVSPDGKYLAFSLSQKNAGDKYYQTSLVIIDLETKDVFDTCLEPDYGGYWSFPIWSPDSKYLSIATGIDRTESNNILILNVKDQTGFKWIEGNRFFPMGWMSGGH